MVPFNVFDGHNDSLGHPPPKLWPWRALLLPLVIALPIAALCVQYQFDGLYGQDAYAYYDYAMDTVRRDLQAQRLPSPFFWPPGYPLLVALVSLVAGERPLAAQAVSLVAGALVPLLVALMAHELWQIEAQAGRRLAGGGGHALQATGFAAAAGLVAALTPQLWQSSAVSMSDTTALAAATLGIGALLRYQRAGRAAMLALASAALAFALLTRMVYGALAVVAAVYALWLLRRRPWRSAVAHAALAGFVALLALAPLIAALLQPRAEGAGLPFLGHMGRDWWRLGNALQRQFVTGNGNLHYRLPNGLYYALTPAHRYTFTPLLAPLLLPGLWRLWKQRPAAHVWLLLGWPAMITLLLAGYPAQNFRFTLAFLPPLAILLTMGLFSALHMAGRLRPLFILLLAGGGLWMIAGGWTLTESFMARKQADLATVQWLEERSAPQAQLLTFGITLTVAHYSAIESHDLYNQTPAGVSALLQSSRPTYLLLDVPNIERQWAGHAPGENYRFLRDEYLMNHLGDRRAYSLFEIVGER